MTFEEWDAHWFREFEQLVDAFGLDIAMDIAYETTVKLFGFPPEEEMS